MSNTTNNTEQAPQAAGPLGHIHDVDVLLPYYSELKQTHDNYAEAVKKLKRDMEVAENRIASLTLHGDAQSVTLPQGKIEIKHQEVFNCTDWDAFYQWVAKDPINRLTGFLQKRLGSTALKKFMSDSAGQLPDGVKAETISKIKITLNKPE